MGDWKIYLVTIVILVNLLYRSHGLKIENGKDIKRKQQREIVIEDVSDLSVYYKLKDNTTIKEMMPRPWYVPGQVLRLPFIGEPCACRDLQCGCCAGIRITQFSFDKKACANITYDPYLFAIILDVNLNGVSALHQVISAKNPPNICIPIPIGGGIVGVDFCIKLFEIYTPEVRNVHICMDWQIRISQAPILILHFDCLKFGYDGILLQKPDTSTSQASPDEASIEPGQIDGEIYDEVTEIKSGLVTENPNEFENTTYVIDDSTVIYDDVENDTLLIQNEIDGDLKADIIKLNLESIQSSESSLN